MAGRRPGTAADAPIPVRGRSMPQVRVNYEAVQKNGECGDAYDFIEKVNKGEAVRAARRFALLNARISRDDFLVGAWLDETNTVSKSPFWH